MYSLIFGVKNLYFSTRHSISLILSIIALSLSVSSAVKAANFTTGIETAKKFGTHEIILSGNSSVSNPFDTICTVTFTSPSGQSKQVHAFYDGGNTWRARAYITEVGIWNWTSSSSDSQLNNKSGSFNADNSSLRGMLKKHSSNPKQWMTDDGKTFLNINDTAYYLFGSKDLQGDTISDSTFQQFIRDDVSMNVTSVRAVINGALRDASWSNFFGSNRDRFNTTAFQRTDSRMRWMLDNYPDMYLQLIIFGEPNRGYAQDENMWAGLSSTQRTRILRYIIARYAAFPQVFWLTLNDAYHNSDHPNNNKLAEDVGNYFRDNDPWDHLFSTGRNRGQKAPYPTASWNTYIHLETNIALSADQIKDYANLPQHVFNGEDQYERTDRGGNWKYFYRWIMWSWLLSEGSCNYGSADWKAIRPYHSTNWQGLDSVKFIAPYLRARAIDFAQWKEADGITSDADGATGARRTQGMRKGNSEFLVYHPNSAQASIDPTLKSSAAKIRIDLSAVSGSFQVEWYRASDGVAQAGGTVQGGASRTLTAPWSGQDVVLYLKSQGNGTPEPQLTYTLQLKANWNLISLPIDPSDEDIADVLAPINGTYEAVHAWNGKEYESYYPGNAAASTLKKIEAGRGYWIFMNQAGSLFIKGTAAGKTITLGNDWNLVGYNSTTSMSAAQALATTNGKVTAVYSFNTTENKYEIVETFQPGAGYWMYASEGSNWTLP